MYYRNFNDRKEICLLFFLLLEKQVLSENIIKNFPEFFLTKTLVKNGILTKNKNCCIVIMCKHFMYIYLKKKIDQKRVSPANLRHVNTLLKEKTQWQLKKLNLLVTCFRHWCIADHRLEVRKPIFILSMERMPTFPFFSN